MASTDIERELLAALEAAAPEHGIDVVDVEVVGASKAPVVRVRLDHADESLPRARTRSRYRALACRGRFAAPTTSSASRARTCR